MAYLVVVGGHEVADSVNKWHIFDPIRNLPEEIREAFALQGLGDRALRDVGPGQLAGSAGHRLVQPLGALNGNVALQEAVQPHDLRERHHVVLREEQRAQAQLRFGEGAGVGFVELPQLVEELRLRAELVHDQALDNC